MQKQIGVINTSVLLEELTIYVSHTCDLACDNCFTFNNLSWGKHFEPPDVEKYKKFAADVKFKEVFILGGEATTNPHLHKWMQWVEELWPDAKHWIVTNGRNMERLSKKYPNWWSHGWHVEISAHSPKDLDTVVAWMDANWADHTRERFFCNQHEDGDWHYELKVDDKYVGELSEAWSFHKTPVVLQTNKPITWRGLSDKNEQHKLCLAKYCLHFFNERFYRCPQQALMPELVKKFHVNEPYKSIAEQDVGCNAEEFLEWIKTQDEPQEHCRLCKWGDKVELPTKSKTKKIKVAQR